MNNFSPVVLHNITASTAAPSGRRNIKLSAKVKVITIVSTASKVSVPKSIFVAHFSAAFAAAFALAILAVFAVAAAVAAAEFAD